MEKRKNYIVIDPVLDRFNEEKQFTGKKDYYMNIDGIPIQFLNGTEGNQASAIDLVDVVIGNDLQGIEGLGSTEQDDAMFKYLIKSRNVIANNPETISKVQNPKQAIDMFNYAIKYWNTDKRDEALERLAKEETRLIEKGNILLGTDMEEDEYDWEEETFSESEPEEEGYIYHNIEQPGVSGQLGRRRRRPRKKGAFWNKLKSGVKKVGSGIKKVTKKAIHAVVKYNPLSIAARGGLLLAFRTNMLKMSDKLKYGYLTEQEAKAKGMDIAEWKKLKTTFGKVEKLFVKRLKGKPKNMKKAILSGKRKSFAGFGEPVTTAAGTAAASGFIATIAGWLKKINVSKLFKKKPEKEAFKEQYKKEHGESKGWRKDWRSKADNTTAKTKSGKSNITENIPNSRQQSNIVANVTPSYSSPVSTVSFAQKTKTFVKKHGKKIGIGILAIAGLSVAASPKARSKLGIKKKPKNIAPPKPNNNTGVSGTKNLKTIKLS